MIEVRKTYNDLYTITMSSRSPLIYLDNWAIVKISRDALIQNHFISALKQKNGTLLFSYLNIIELGRKQGDELQKIRTFLYNIGTDWCLVDIDAVAVIEREENLEASAMPPNFDEQALRSYYPYIHDQSLTLTKIIDLIENQKDSYDQIYNRFEKLAIRLTELRKAIKNCDPLINPDAYKVRKYDPKKPTLYAYHKLMRKMLYSDFKITKNHICDLQHATAALAYADLILLDGHWHDLAKNNLKDLPCLEWRLFRDSPKEMERFLKTLESLELIETNP